MKMYAVFNYFNRYIERLNYSCHGSFLNFDCDNNVITTSIEYDVEYYMPIYKIVNVISDHSKKVNDIISEYNFNEEQLYRFLFHYLGQRDHIQNGPCKSFTNEEIKLLDNIEHVDYHTDIKPQNTNIRGEYFLDLDEYLYGK